MLAKGGGDLLARKDKLTVKQRAFADEYIANKGNATQAYFKAYPSTKKESTANVNGSKLLRNAKVSKYIADRTAEILEKAKMDQTEILITLTSIARREQQTSHSKKYNHLTDEVEQEITFTFQPSVEEATRALEVLVKFLGTPLENEKTKLEIEKLKQQVQGISEGQDDKITHYINLVKSEVVDE